MSTNNSLNNSSAPFTVTAGNLTVTAGNINLPAFNAGGTQGVITIGGNNAFTTDASSNIFIGISTGRTALSGTNNLACGNVALQAITSGSGNCLYGNSVMQTATTGTGNVAFGHAAYNIGNGSNNLIMGGSSGALLTTGNTNVFIGNSAGFNSGGPSGVTTGSNNILIGYTAANAYTGAESNNIIIGDTAAVVGDNNTCRIGFAGTPLSKTFIDGIAGIVVANQNLVTINTSTGQLGSTTVSSSSMVGTALSTISQVGVVSYLAPFDNNPQTTLGLGQLIMPTAGTLSNLYVNAKVNSNTSNTTVTLNVNGSTTTLVATVTASTTGAFSDTTHSVSVNAGDLITFQSSAATVGTLIGRISMKLVA